MGRAWRLTPNQADLTAEMMIHCVGSSMLDTPSVLVCPRYGCVWVAASPGSPSPETEFASTCNSHSENES